MWHVMCSFSKVAVLVMIINQYFLAKNALILYITDSTFAHEYYITELVIILSEIGIIDLMNYLFL
jgi:hypothetical protein